APPRRASARAAAPLEAARTAYAEAQAADAAAALRAHLVAGEPCPVCTQPVAAVPPAHAGSAVAKAKAAGAEARRVADAARDRLAERDQVLRALDQALTASRTQLDLLADRARDLDAKLAGAPGPEAVRQELAGLAALERDLAAAGAAVRTAREAHRRAEAAADSAERDLRESWREFDAARDALAAHSPPPADRDDLAAAWSALADWAARRAEELRRGRPEAAGALAAATAAVAQQRQRLADLLWGAGLRAPEGVATGAATGAAERARAERGRLREGRAQADRRREQGSGLVEDARVARALAHHPRANSFEAWLLEEALDRLGEGAS